MTEKMTFRTGALAILIGMTGIACERVTVQSEISQSASTERSMDSPLELRNGRKPTPSPSPSPAPSPTPTYGPYSGTAPTVPGVINAAHFDRGGQGKAYYDSTAGNQGGAFRTSEDVDIITATDTYGGGYAINGFTTGEWVNYTINAASSGTYRVRLRVSSNYATAGGFHVELDGTRVTGTITVPQTGSWTTFGFVDSPVFSISAGTHVLRIVCDQQYFNFDAVSIAAATAPVPSPSPTPSPSPSPSPTPTPTQSASFTPPIGIPAPSFGINQVAGAANSFVDNTNPSATDTNNPYGTSTVPRRTIPTSLPAGAVVEVRGGPYSVASGLTINGAGTSSNPVFIKGVGAPVFNGNLTQLLFTGNYLIVDGLVFNGVALRLTGNFLALRNSEARGLNSTSNNIVVLPRGTDIVIYKCRIHDNGDLNASYDLDVHAVKPGTGTARLWVLDSEIYRNAGDSVQVGDALDAEPWAQYIYIGRNDLYANRQVAVGVKRARDVIASQNRMHDFKASVSSGGAATVVQTGAQRVWFLNNEVFNSEHGATGDNSVSDIYYVQNVYHDIHSPNYTSSNLWSGAVASGYAQNVYYVGNTMWNIDTGIVMTAGTGTGQVVNNIIGGTMQSNAYHVYFSSNIPGAVVSNNLVTTTPKIAMGGTPSNTVQGDPRFVNALMQDYRLQSTSAAIDRGTPHEVYTWFRSRYGINIAVDSKDVIRPQNVWDIGAFEFK